MLIHLKFRPVFLVGYSDLLVVGLLKKRFFKCGHNKRMLTDSKLDLGLPWSNRFLSLGEEFFTRLTPTPLPQVHWVSTHLSFAKELGLSANTFENSAFLNALSGNGAILGSEPAASVYSGHQFGHWAGQLGDGRAIYLGEIQTLKGNYEIQLKGAGKTPYSRSGDGRAVLRSSIREYLCSEAMHSLTVPTTRALCITGSSGLVYREEVETAAIVTRMAPSFIRFGHFEHFAARGQIDNLKKLADFVIKEYSSLLVDSTQESFYPNEELKTLIQGNVYAQFLYRVTLKTAHLIALWQSVGFCHGVMNTDNMSILGLTLDYGPFQFMDDFDKNHICNHSDHSGRYAFDQQPNIGYWNLYCLGQALLPLIEDKELTVQCLDVYKSAYPKFALALSLKKLGLDSTELKPQASELVKEIETIMQIQGVDFTIFWRTLSQCVSKIETTKKTDNLEGIDYFKGVSNLITHPDAQLLWAKWAPCYLEFLFAQSLSPKEIGQKMMKINPKFVLRNHLGETAIQKAQNGDFSEIEILLRILTNPYDEHMEFESFASQPPQWAKSISISCSS